MQHRCGRHQLFAVDYFESSTHCEEINTATDFPAQTELKIA